MSSYSVEKVWDGEYYQGGVAQFIVHGDTNQTNISCTVRYYYIENPLSTNETVIQEAVKWLKVPKLDETGTGLFQFVLNNSNGFNRIGGYNLTFYFGEDLQNETGIEYYTAPRNYTQIMVNLNQRAIIDAEKVDDARDLAIMKGWEKIFGNAMIFGIALVFAIVIILIIREIKPVETWKKFKNFCGRGAHFIGALRSNLKLKKAFTSNPAIYFNLLGTIFGLQATKIKKNEIEPLEKKLDKAYKEFDASSILSEKYFEKEQDVLKSKMEEETIKPDDSFIMEMPKDDSSNPGHKKKGRPKGSKNKRRKQ